MKRFTRIVILIGITAILSCKKDKPVSQPNTTIPDIPLALSPNVQSIDSATVELNMDSSLLAEGVYEFTLNRAIDTIKAGDVLVGDQGEGFIRKVNTVNYQGNKIICQTSQGALEDIYKEGTLRVSTNVNDLAKDDDGYSYNFSKKKIFQDGPLSLTLESGRINVKTNWDVAFQFEENELKQFELKTNGAVFEAEFSAKLEASEKYSILNRNDVIASTEKYVLLSATPVPVFGKIQVDLVLKSSIDFSQSISRTYTFNNKTTFSLGANYSESNGWSSNASFQPVNSVNASTVDAQQNIKVKLDLVPKVSFKIMGFVGPYLSLAGKGEINAAIGTYNGKVGADFRADAWAAVTVGANAAIFGHKLADYSRSWETDKISYITPNKVEILSGNGQKGSFGQKLPAPLKVKVTDSKGLIQSNIPVYFAVVSGGGEVSKAEVLTNSSGVAETEFTLGTSGPQAITATVFKGDGSQISNSPQRFNIAADGEPTDIFEFLQVGNSWTYEVFKTETDTNGIDVDPETSQQISTITEANDNSYVLSEGVGDFPHLRMSREDDGLSYNSYTGPGLEFIPDSMYAGQTFTSKGLKYTVTETKNVLSTPAGLISDCYKIESDSGYSSSLGQYKKIIWFNYKISKVKVEFHYAARSCCKAHRSIYTLKSKNF